MTDGQTGRRADGQTAGQLRGGAAAPPRELQAGVLLLGAIAAVALLVPVIHGPVSSELTDIVHRRFVAPFGHTPGGTFHLLGTDRFGRDLLVRLSSGARVSLVVGLLAAVVSTVLGVVLGSLAGYAGGRTDRALSALTDAALAIPRVPLLLLLVALFQPGIAVTVLAIGFTGWMTVMRLVRAEVKALKERLFVEAARALGMPALRVMARHLIPHAIGPALVATALGVGSAIMLEAGLSFLGLGIQPPTPSWGNMIAAGRDALVVAPWVALVPAAMVALVVLACSLVAEGLEHRLTGADAARQGVTVTATESAR
jgi:peptide/nickel transport system permease protein